MEEGANHETKPRPHATHATQRNATRKTSPSSSVRNPLYTVVPSYTVSTKSGHRYELRGNVGKYTPYHTASTINPNIG